MSTDAQYLKDLADELMHPCLDAGPDQGDKIRLYRIADRHGELVEMLRFLDDDTRKCPVCGVEYTHADDCKLKVLLAEAEGEEDGH